MTCLCPAQLVPTSGDTDANCLPPPKTAAGGGTCGTSAQAGTSQGKGSLWLRLSMKKGRKGVSLNVFFLLWGFCVLFFLSQYPNQ